MTVKCLRSFGDHSVHVRFIRFSTTLYLIKRLVAEENGPKFGPRRVVNSAYEELWLLSFQSQSGVIRYISEISDFQQLCILKRAGRRETTD